jgi:transketolase
MKIDDRSIKIWSTIGQRATLGVAALDIAKRNNNLIVLTCDVSTSAGLDRFRKTLPEQFIDLGIAEQNLIGIATGLASEKFDVITTTFAPFQTMRCCEQIKVNLGYMSHKVCMVGLASGLALGTLGFTHCCIEDVGVLRSIPGISIISPADGLETVKALNAAVKYNGPTYVRLTGTSNNPIVYNQDYDFEIGKAVKLKQGKDIAIFCTGPTVYNSLKAAEILENKDISCSVVNFHTIKPLDTEIILEMINHKMIVTIEEHNIIGGLGSAVSEFKSTLNQTPKQLFLGVKDFYSKGGSYNYLLNKHGLTKDKIVESILKNYN